MQTELRRINANELNLSFAAYKLITGKLPTSNTVSDLCQIKDWLTAVLVHYNVDIIATMSRNEAAACIAESVDVHIHLLKL